MAADGDDGDRGAGAARGGGKGPRRLALASKSLPSVVAYAGHELNNQAALLLSTVELLRHEVTAASRGAATDPSACAAALAAVAETLDDQEAAIQRIARVSRRLRAASGETPGGAALDGAGSAAHDPAAADAPPPGARSSTPPTARRRILFVDDEPGLRSALGHLLRRHHDVEIVESGEEALARLAGGASYDVVLCDLMMPGLDGAAVHAAIRRDHADRVGAFVLSTGGAFEAEAHELVESGEVPVLFKPYALKELLALVERAAPPTAPASAPAPPRPPARPASSRARPRRA